MCVIRILLSSCVLCKWLVFGSMWKRLALTAGGMPRRGRSLVVAMRFAHQAGLVRTMRRQRMRHVAGERMVAVLCAVRLGRSAASTCHVHAAARGRRNECRASQGGQSFRVRSRVETDRYTALFRLIMCPMERWCMVTGKCHIIRNLLKDVN